VSPGVGFGEVCLPASGAPTATGDGLGDGVRRRQRGRGTKTFFCPRKFSVRFYMKPSLQSNKHLCIKGFETIRCRKYINERVD
jgi:hypothetical protein